VASLRPGGIARFWTTIVCAAVVATGVVCSFAVTGCSAARQDRAASARPGPDVYTPAHATVGDAVADFFSVRVRPVQPIEFPHKIHIDKGMTCTQYCHEPVEKGPIAGLPSINICMTCHSAIATDRPLVKQIAALQEKGLDLSWQRVYGYTHQAHVRFNHAPHIRANVECSTCHGDIANQNVAQRNVDLHVGFCVSCHRQKNAPNECITCHF
jgi:formamidopyrimidine-DNA glycosylase